MSTMRVVDLNVGGFTFTTTQSTLTKEPGSMLALMFDGTIEPSCKDMNGRYFIDRDGSTFKYVLAYLRGEALPAAGYDRCQLARDADFYQLAGLVDLLEYDARRGTASSISGVDQMHASTALANQRQCLISEAGAELQLAIHTILQRLWASTSDSRSVYRPATNLSRRTNELSLISDCKGSKVGSKRAAQNFQVLEHELAILGYQMSADRDNLYISLAPGVSERFWEQQGKHS